MNYILYLLNIEAKIAMEDKIMVRNPEDTEKTAGGEDSSVRRTFDGIGATWLEIRLMVMF